MLILAIDIGDRGTENVPLISGVVVGNICCDDLSPSNWLVIVQVLQETINWREGGVCGSLVSFMMVDSSSTSSSSSSDGTGTSSDEEGITTLSPSLFFGIFCIVGEC